MVKSLISRWSCSEKAPVLVNIGCPHCQTKMVVENDPGIAMVACVKCSSEFHVSQGMGLLDRTEYSVRRMVLGLVEFACHRIPAWLYGLVIDAIERLLDFFVWLLPLSAQIIRIGGWGGLWLFIWFAPTLLFGGIALKANAVNAKGLSFTLAATALFWFGAVTCGYAWALWHYRRRRQETPSRQASSSNFLVSGHAETRQLTATVTPTQRS